MSYYVLGLGDTGLSVVRHLQRLKHPVTVCDTRLQPPGLDDFRRLYPDIPLQLGPWQEDAFVAATHIVLSPGLSPNDPALAAVRQQGVAIDGDIELFAQVAQAPIVAITGTNAKGTVTTLIADMLRAAGKRVLVGGNIGTPALDLLLEPVPDYYVLELSSFQLETTTSLQAEIAVILNLSEDHLDRHGSMAAYLAAKQRIYHGARMVVTNRDQSPMYAGAITVSFGTTAPRTSQELGLVMVEGAWYLARGEEKLLAVERLAIKGQHNALNALAALALGFSLQLPLEAMLRALLAFTGLEHRCQWVMTQNAVTWINDSKATNVGATLAALNGLGSSCAGKIVLIAGGQGKGQDFGPLKAAVTRYCRSVILLGQDAPLLTQVLQGSTPLVSVTTLQAAVLAATQLAQPDDIVLLSPACASLDMFHNYGDRGRQFADLARQTLACE